MFHNVLGLWDGLDECEISRPEILPQSAPALKYSNMRDAPFSINLCELYQRLRLFWWIFYSEADKNECGKQNSKKNKQTTQ